MSKNKMIGIITGVLLVILVVVGLVMVFTKQDNKTGSENKKESDNNRCVNKVCISKVSIEEQDGQKQVLLSLKNEGTEKITNECVKIDANGQEFELCVNELEPNSDLMLAFEYVEGTSTKIEDYSMTDVPNQEIDTKPQEQQPEQTPTETPVQ